MAPHFYKIATKQKKEEEEYGSLSVTVLLVQNLVH